MEISKSKQWRYQKILYVTVNNTKIEFKDCRTAATSFYDVCDKQTYPAIEAREQNFLNLNAPKSREQQFGEYF